MELGFVGNGVVVGSNGVGVRKLVCVPYGRSKSVICTAKNSSGKNRKARRRRKDSSDDDDAPGLNTGSGTSGSFRDDELVKLMREDYSKPLLTESEKPSLKFRNRKSNKYEETPAMRIAKLSAWIGIFGAIAVELFVQLAPKDALEKIKW